MKKKFKKLNTEELKKIALRKYEPPRILVRGVQEKSPSANWSNVGTFLLQDDGKNN